MDRTPEEITTDVKEKHESNILFPNCIVLLLMIISNNIRITIISILSIMIHYEFEY